jgi:cysteinyl-tRNA synthetase
MFRKTQQAACWARSSRSRCQGRYESADRIREAFAAGGIELRDAPDGTDWLAHDPCRTTAAP